MAVSIVLSNQNIKLVSTRKNIPEKWVTVSLPAGLMKDGRILEPQALSKEIDTLFTSLDLPRNEVVVSLTGISFTYRVLVLPGVKSGQQREAIERATRKELKVSLDELYVDWQIFADTGKEIKVFVLGIPRQLIDALLKTMALARVSLTQVGIKSLALSRTANQVDALIVDFEPDWFDIAIISRGAPVTLHTVAPKSQAASLEDNVLQLKDELNRTVDFFNFTHKENAISSDMPVILTGSLGNDPERSALILEKLGRPRQNMTSLLKAPGNFPLNLYADNLGLLLKSIHQDGPQKNGADSYLDINVDPLNGRKRAMAHPLSLRKIIPYAAAILAVVLVIALFQMRNQVAAETGKLQAESDRLSRNLRISRLSLDEAAILEGETNKLNTETLALQKERELISGSGNLSSIVEFIAGQLPPDSFYSQVTSTTEELVLEGKAARRSDIIDYANTLKNSGKFSEVRIALIEDVPDNTCVFKIVIRRGGL